MENISSFPDQPSISESAEAAARTLVRAIKAQERVESLQFPLGCNVIVQSPKSKFHKQTGVVVGSHEESGMYQVKIDSNPVEGEITMFLGGHLAAQEDNVADLPTGGETFFQPDRVAELYEEIGESVGLFKVGQDEGMRHNPFRENYAKQRLTHSKKRPRSFSSVSSTASKPNSKRPIPENTESLNTTTTTSWVDDCMNSTCSNEDQSRWQELEDETLLRLAESFFQPGVRFVGYIVIPGMENCLPDDDDAKTFQRQKYTLTVVRLEKDELGKNVIIGRHAAYTDEQAFAIELKVVDCCDVKRTPSAQETANTQAKIDKRKAALAAAAAAEKGEKVTEKVASVNTDKSRCNNNNSSSNQTVENDTNCSSTTSQQDARKSNTTCNRTCRVTETRKESDSSSETSEDNSGTCGIKGHSRCDENGACRERVVQISYADLETSCVGTIDFELGNIRGFVYQLKEGQEGFFYNSMEATHTFNVVCECYNLNYIQRSAALINAKSERVIALAKWFMSCSDHALIESLDRVVWTNVFRDTVVLAEEWCATMRRQSAMLTNLHFKTVEEKTAIFDRLREAGVNRSLAHRKSDLFIRHLNVVGSAVGALHQVGEADKQRIVYDMIRLVNKEIFRLNSSFRRLDNAIRSCESRLPEDLLESWKCKGNDIDICVICMFILKASHNALRLPCGHIFHNDCANTWLHSNTSCPFCRSALGVTVLDTSTNAESEIVNPANSKRIEYSTTKPASNTASTSGAAAARPGSSSQQETQPKAVGADQDRPLEDRREYTGSSSATAGSSSEAAAAGRSSINTEEDTAKPGSKES